VKWLVEIGRALLAEMHRFVGTDTVDAGGGNDGEHLLSGVSAPEFPQRGGAFSLPEYAAGALNENLELASCFIPRIDGAFLNGAHDRDSDVRAIASYAARCGPLMALLKVVA
jgi:hypothetical protein